MTTDPQQPGVTLRRLPYPYRAMLAICSDLDETPDWQTYHEIARFLNTTETTSMGPGVGLEVGNTIYFDMAPSQFAYWNTSDAGRAMVRAMIQSGHIDCIHSYGDLATTRAQAGKALDELVRHDCRLQVWVDHSKAVTNFGADIMTGQGDVTSSPAYHADLTTGYGIRYVWRGRVTQMIGQDLPPSLGGIFTPRHPMASAKAMIKEAAKHFLGRRGNAKFAMHGANQVLRAGLLRDGRAVYEFMRGDGYWGPIGEAATAEGIAESLTERFLDRLVYREGICVFYTHLGKVGRAASPFTPATQEAFRRLAEYAADNRILVLTTHRLLRYMTTRNSLRFRAKTESNTTVIKVQGIDDPVYGLQGSDSGDLEGITFEATRCEHIRIETPDGTEIPCHITRENDVCLATIDWPRLTFPAL